MKPFFIVGTFALVTSVSLVMWSSGGRSQNRIDGRTRASPGATDFAGKATVTPDATAGAAHELARLAGTQPAESDRTARRVKQTLVLGEGHGGFRLNSLVLSDEARAKLDELVSAMTEEDLSSARFEIEGHTDSLGSKDVNERIGLARALAVKMYLCEQFEIDPGAIRVASYGLEKPIADNATQEGRALNRRVVIKVLE